MEVGRLREGGNNNVGGIPGLYLQIINGSRTWIRRFKIGTRRRRMGLDSFLAIPLAQARERASEAHKLIDSGVDPAQPRRSLFPVPWESRSGTRPRRCRLRNVSFSSTPCPTDGSRRALPTVAARASRTDTKQPKGHT